MVHLIFYFLKVIILFSDWPSTQLYETTMMTVTESTTGLEATSILSKDGATGLEIQ